MLNESFNLFFFLDINECENAVLCSQQCNNTEGSFFCSCSAGFKIGDDRETCEGTENTLHTQLLLFSFFRSLLKVF